MSDVKTILSGPGDEDIRVLLSSLKDIQGYGSKIPNCILSTGEPKDNTDEGT